MGQCKACRHWWRWGFTGAYGECGKVNVSAYPSHQEKGHFFILYEGERPSVSLLFLL